MGKMGIGLQLYTLREEMKADMEGTLRKVAALGYEGVEFAGYFGMPAGQLRTLLDELNLKAIGNHAGLKDLRENLPEQIDFLKTIGGSYLVCPFLPLEERETEEGWKALIASLEEYAQEILSQGLEFAYHNHSFEFEATVNGDFAFDAIFKLTSPEAVKVEMDVCWVHYAGQEPLFYIRKYAGRLPLLHLKDYRIDGNGAESLELGQGVVPLRDVIQTSAESGVQWLIVEQEQFRNPPLESVANNRGWLKKNGF